MPRRDFVGLRGLPVAQNAVVGSGVVASRWAQCPAFAARACALMRTVGMALCLGVLLQTWFRRARRYPRFSVDFFLRKERRNAESRNIYWMRQPMKSRAAKAQRRGVRSAAPPSERNIKGCLGDMTGCAAWLVSWGVDVRLISEQGCSVLEPSAAWADVPAVATSRC